MSDNLKFEEKMLLFSPDAGLMYLVQQVTGKSTDEILGFFYDFGKEVFITGINNMKPNQRSIRKNIEILYPGTSIPILINVGGVKRPTSYRGILTVTFPSNPNYMDTAKLMDVIMEKALLGGSSLPDFEPPRSKTPHMYKELIDSVLKGSQKV